MDVCCCIYFLSFSFSFSRFSLCWSLDDEISNCFLKIFIFGNQINLYYVILYKFCMYTSITGMYSSYVFRFEFHHNHHQHQMLTASLREREQQKKGTRVMWWLHTAPRLMKCTSKFKSNTLFTVDDPNIDKYSKHNQLLITILIGMRISCDYNWIPLILIWSLVSLKI